VVNQIHSEVTISSSRLDIYSSGNILTQVMIPTKYNHNSKSPSAFEG